MCVCVRHTIGLYRAKHFWHKIRYVIGNGIKNARLVLLLPKLFHSLVAIAVVVVAHAMINACKQLEVSNYVTRMYCAISSRVLRCHIHRVSVCVCVRVYIERVLNAYLSINFQLNKHF